MSRASLFQAIASASEGSPPMESTSSQASLEVALAEEDHGALAEMLKTTRPSFVICLQPQAHAQNLQGLAHHVAQAQALPCHLLAVTLDGAAPLPGSAEWPDGMTVAWYSLRQGINDLTSLLARHDVKADALVTESSLPPAGMAEWLGAAPQLLHDQGWAFGMHGWDGSTFKSIEQAAVAQRLHLTFTANVWIATPTAWVMPRFAAPIAGTVEPIRFGSVTSSTDEVKDKEAFLACVTQGLSVHQKIEGGQKFSNALPVNIRNQNAETQADYKSLHFPPFKEHDTTEPKLIAQLRDVRVSGVRAYLYTRHNELLEESFGNGVESIKALKGIIPPYEPIVVKAVASSAHIQWQAMAGVFPPSVPLKETYVVAMWPDTYIYHHWLIACITRFWYLDVYPELARVPIVMNPFLRKYQFEYMDMLGLRENRLVFSNESISLQLQNAIYPTQIGTPPHSPQTIDWLRNKFLPHAGKVPAGYENGHYYISRKDGRSREILNEAEILEFLQPYGFKVVQWSMFSVAEQIAMAHHAKVIIGAHGSNMSNTVYINPGCKVLDIRSAKTTSDDPTLSAATMRISGHLYVTPTRRTHTNLETGDNSVPDMSHDNYLVDFTDFKAVFTQMMEA